MGNGPIIAGFDVHHIVHQKTKKPDMIQYPVTHWRMWTTNKKGLAPKKVQKTFECMIIGVHPIGAGRAAALPA